MARPFPLAALLALICLGAGAAQAEIITCIRPGVPVHCTPAAEVAPAGPVANPTPGVGYGARGVGLTPAAGPGAGPNAGGPVNRAGYR